MAGLFGSSTSRLSVCHRFGGWPVFPIMKRLFLRAIGMDRQRKRLADSTLRQYVSRLKTRLWRALGLKPSHPEGKKWLWRYRRLCDNLLRFLDTDGVPLTNNSSEWALRPSVIFRKVTNGFRSHWGAELFSRVCSLVGTAQRQGISAFEAILKAITSTRYTWLLGWAITNLWFRLWDFI